jgi:hypothetical protein
MKTSLADIKQNSVQRDIDPSAQDIDVPSERR